MKKSNPSYNYSNFNYFIDNISYIERNKFESVLQIVISKIKIKFPKILKNLPLIIISNRNSDVLIYFENNKSGAQNTIDIPIREINTLTTYELADSILHELGHFVYTVILNDRKRKYWLQYWLKNIKEIDVNLIIKVLKKYKKEEIKFKYPLIYINLKSLRFSKNFHPSINIFDAEDFKNYITFKKLKTIPFSKKPITAYSMESYENGKEAFAELFALYTYYNNKYVLDDNIRILNYLID